MEYVIWMTCPSSCSTLHIIPDGNFQDNKLKIQPNVKKRKPRNIPTGTVCFDNLDTPETLHNKVGTLDTSKINLRQNITVRLLSETLSQTVLKAISQNLVCNCFQRDELSNRLIALIPKKDCYSLMTLLCSIFNGRCYKYADKIFLRSAYNFELTLKMEAILENRDARRQCLDILLEIAVACYIAAITNINLIDGFKNTATSITETAAANTATLGIESAAQVVGNAVAGAAISAIVDVAITSATIYLAKREKDEGRITQKEYTTKIKKTVCESSLKFVGGTTGSILGQVFIPVPVVGAFVGGFCGSLIGAGIGKGINYGVFDRRNSKAEHHIDQSLETSQLKIHKRKFRGHVRKITVFVEQDNVFEEKSFEKSTKNYIRHEVIKTADINVSVQTGDVDMRPFVRQWNKLSNNDTSKTNNESAEISAQSSDGNKSVFSTWKKVTSGISSLDFSARRSCETEIDHKETWKRTQSFKSQHNLYPPWQQRSKSLETDYFTEPSEEKLKYGSHQEFLLHSDKRNGANKEKQSDISISEKKRKLLTRKTGYLREKISSSSMPFRNFKLSVRKKPNDDERKRSKDKSISENYETSVETSYSKEAHQEEEDSETKPLRKLSMKSLSNKLHTLSASFEERNHLTENIQKHSRSFDSKDGSIPDDVYNICNNFPTPPEHNVMPTPEHNDFPTSDQQQCSAHERQRSQILKRFQKSFKSRNSRSKKIQKFDPIKCSTGVVEVQELTSKIDLRDNDPNEYKQVITEITLKTLAPSTISTDPDDSLYDKDNNLTSNVVLSENNETKPRSEKFGMFQFKKKFSESNTVLSGNKIRNLFGSSREGRTNGLFSFPWSGKDTDLTTGCSINTELGTGCSRNTELGTGCSAKTELGTGCSEGAQSGIRCSEECKEISKRNSLSTNTIPELHLEGKLIEVQKIDPRSELQEMKQSVDSTSSNRREIATSACSIRTSDYDVAINTHSSENNACALNTDTNICDNNAHDNAQDNAQDSDGILSHNEFEENEQNTFQGDSHKDTVDKKPSFNLFKEYISSKFRN